MKVMGERSGFKLCSVLVSAVFLSSLALLITPAGQASTRVGQYQGPGSLPEVGKIINQLIYPTFGNPAIVPKGYELTIEWDWRFGDASPDVPAPPTSNPSDWKAYVTTAVAANVQHYNGTSPREIDWYRNPGKYGYGTYENPVHTVVNTRDLKVTKVERAVSNHWPVVFGNEGFAVEKITVEIPRSVPLDLYDLHVGYKPALPADYKSWAPPGHGDWRSDVQLHALQVIKGYNKSAKVIHISDTHVFGQEIENGWGGGLNYKSFQLREPRPGTPDRPTLFHPLTPGFDSFPFDKDNDTKTNEGAIYLQEELQAINLINPDFVVLTGDTLFGMHNFSTYPNGDDIGGGSATGNTGSEYRFEMPWIYDELLALNVPVYCIPGNHDGRNWDERDFTDPETGKVYHDGVLPHDDGLEIWQDIFGPTYFSWDYGESHFLGLNSMDWPKVDPNPPVPNPDDPTWKLLHLLFGDTFVEAKYSFQDRGGFVVSPKKLSFPWNLIPLSIIDPHQDGGRIGDTQLRWIGQDLAGNSDKALLGVFTHHGVLGETWQGAPQLTDLMRRYSVAFEAWGHSHEDYVITGQFPWDDGKGEVVGINTEASEVGVDDSGLPENPTGYKVDRHSKYYGGYRLITINEENPPGKRLVGWGFAGADSNPNNMWSIPGWAGVVVGGDDNANTPAQYRNSRPIFQWMEQDNGFTDGIVGARQTVKWGDDGTFSVPLPLNLTGQYTDVTCRVKNSMNKPGAVLDLTGCRIEFPMKLKLLGHSYYKVENGNIAEQYNTDACQRMVVVSAAAPADQTNAVRVYIGGSDWRPPLVDKLFMNSGSHYTKDLNVSLSLEAHDTGAGMMDYRVSNNKYFFGAQWSQYDGSATIPWKLAGNAGQRGFKTTYVQFRDAAMPGNVITKKVTIYYEP